MKRLSLRLSLCVAAVALSAPFMAVQAESHKPFYSRLNPKTWFKKSEPEGRAKVVEDQAKVAPGSATTSVRPHLTEDPFAVPPQDGVKSPSANEKPRTQTADTAKPQIAPKLPQRPNVGDAGSDFEEFGAGTKTTAKNADSRSARKPARNTGANQFEEGFDDEVDALVKSIKRESPSAAPSLPELPTTPRATAKNAPKFDRDLLTETASETTESVRDTAKASASDFEQFVAEREQATPATAADEVPVKELRVAKTSTTPLAKPKRQILDPFSDNPAVSNDAPQLEPSEVVAQSRREIEASGLRTGFSENTTGTTLRDRSTSKLTQTSGTSSLDRERATTDSRSRSNQLPEVRPSLTSRNDLPLIVPNDQVPDRRLYVASQTYRSQAAATTATQPAVAQQATASTPELSLPSVTTTPRSPAPEEITPRVNANRAPTLTLPEPTKVRQLAYEDQTPEPRLPLLSIGGGTQSASAETASGPLLFPSNPLSGDVKADSAKTEVALREKAPTLDWPDAADAVAPAKKKSGALMMVLAIVGVGLGIGYVIRKKAALGTTGGTAVGDSPELGS